MSRRIAPKVWVIAAEDNVGTVVGGEADASQTLPMIGAVSGAIELKSAVPHGHKIALTSLPSGADVLKYGVVIGRLVHAVAAGEHVHTHNLESLRGRGDRLTTQVKGE
jgi:altronate dehydratase small subunit